MADATSNVPPGVKTLVRGPDGALYLLSENNPPVKLEEEDAAEVYELLAETDEKLTKLLKEMPRTEMSCTHLVHVRLPEVFAP